MSVSRRQESLQTFNTACHITGDHGDVIKWKHFPRYWPFVRGNHRPPVNSPHKGPVTRSFDDLRLNKRLSKQSKSRWFETQACSLWRHNNDLGPMRSYPLQWSQMSVMAFQTTIHLIVRLTAYAGNSKENIKIPHYCPLWPESTGHRWIPITKGQ